MTQSNDDVVEFAKTADLDLNLKGRGLKKVPIDIKNKLIKAAIESVCKTENIQYSVDFIGGVNTAFITCGAKADSKDAVDEDAERVYNLISQWIVYNFDNVLSVETGKDPSEYYRTATMFECSIDNGIINLFWS